MKQIFLVAKVAIFALIFQSCSQDRVKSVLNLDTNVRTTYNYEKVGNVYRITTITTSDNSHSVTFNYSTVPHTATVTYGSQTTVYTLNGDDRAISDNRGTGVPGTPYTYEYDVAGHLAKASYPNYTDNRTYNGSTPMLNMDHEWFTPEASWPGSDWDFTYTGNKSPYENMEGYLGTRNENWPLTRTNRATHVVTNYSYTPPTGRVDIQTASGEANYRLKFEYY